MDSSYNLTNATFSVAPAVTNCEDKNFATYLGSRNCGKGVLYDCLVNAFGDYVGSFELSNLLFQRNTKKDLNEVSRKNYWMMDMQFMRLALSQETPTPDMNMKVDGKIFKKLAGGGDEITARRNFDRIDTKFYIDTTFMMLGNDDLVFDPPDTNEHRIEFNSVIQFKSKEEIDRLREDGVSELILSNYAVKDPNLKDKCKTEEWANAMVYLLFENYVTTALPVFRGVDESDETKPLPLQILEKIVVTRDYENDVVTVKKVESLFFNNKKKVHNHLISMGVSKMRYNGSRKEDCKDKLCYFGMKIKQIETEDDDGDTTIEGLSD